MSRTSLKIVGAQGQGINSIGEIVSKGLKRAGYCVFGYREYNSLIKGGHSSYQIDVSNEEIRSTGSTVDVLITVNHHGLEKNLSEVKEGGYVVYYTPQWKFSDEHQKIIDERGIHTIFLPVEETIEKLQTKLILGNVILTSFAWSLLGRDSENLRDLVRERFGHKKELLEINMRCIDEGVRFHEELASNARIELPEPDAQWKKHMLLTGSQAMGLGVIHAGCRAFISYPMTPASPLLTYIADMQNETGMVVKQAEDEITAAQMMSGAMHMGTRAMTATAGGGFDLMTETVSLNGLVENPAVFMLAQRPGPSTGLPTWTAQGDLLLAVGSAHGEFPRLVMAVSDSQDSFDLLPEAFNYAEEFQTPVIVLTDKHIGEALWTQEPYNQKNAEIRRGELVTDPKKLAKLKAADRYDPSAPDGISPRWLPGSEAETYCAQGDEHTADGSVDESSGNATEQMEKRMRKMEALRDKLPDPELYVRTSDFGLRTSEGDESVDVLIVSWGSNKGVILDALKSTELEDKKIGYLHYTYLWPLRTKRFDDLASKAKKTILVECNHQGQLGMLLKMESGLNFDERILKYDGRPFFYDELVYKLQSSLPKL